jgi:hypothetical protein
MGGFSFEARLFNYKGEEGFTKAHEEGWFLEGA